MIDLGVAVAILENNTVLLVRREDADVWCLPGGAVDEGESVSEAAIREVREETGLQVELTSLVGVYSRPSWSSHQVIFAATSIEGIEQTQLGETTALGWFPPEALPTIVPWHRQPIQDVLQGTGGSSVWSLDWLWPFPPDLSRQEIYARRDQSPLSRSEFFLQHFCHLGPGGERRDI
jgi:ADP-ribose pyrophosphatase YjhB (NUDIX family)